MACVTRQIGSTTDRCRAVFPVAAGRDRSPRLYERPIPPSPGLTGRMTGLAGLIRRLSAQSRRSNRLLCSPRADVLGGDGNPEHATTRARDCQRVGISAWQRTPDITPNLATLVPQAYRFRRDTRIKPVEREKTHAEGLRSPTLSRKYAVLRLFISSSWGGISATLWRGEVPVGKIAMTGDNQSN